MTVTASYVGRTAVLWLNPVIAVIPRFYAKNVTIDMTDFFGFAVLWHLTL